MSRSLWAGDIAPAVLRLTDACAEYESERWDYRAAPEHVADEVTDAFYEVARLLAVAIKERP